MGTPALFIAARAFSFSPISRVISGGGPMNLMLQVSADFGEVGIFRQQAVAGMDGVHVGDFGRADHRRNIEIALRQLRRADADGFIGKTHVQRVAVGFAVDGDRADAQFFAGTDHPQGNFSAIGDQDFLEHALDQCAKKLYHRGTADTRKVKTETTLG